MPGKTRTRRSRSTRSHQKASTRAGRFVKTEMKHKKSGKHAKRHPIKSRKQAIAIGLNKARKAGVRVPRKKGSSRRSHG